MFPSKFWPGVTVSRFVPSASIVASRFAWLEAETPTTATIAPIPIAIPSADSAARSRRVRRPCSATPSSSRGGRRAASKRSRPGSAAAAVLISAVVADDLAVAHLDPPGKRRGDVVIVGDQHQRRAVGRELVEQGHDLGARLRVEVPGRLVGEDDRRPLGERPRDRDPLALASRELRRPVGEPMAEADTFERGPCRLAPLAPADPRVEQPVGDVVDGGHRVLEVERLEHEPDLVRPQPGQLAVRRLRDVAPGDPDLAAGGPLERSQDRQHRGLSRARRTDHRHLIAGRDIDPDVRSAATPPGYSFSTWSSASITHPWESVTSSPG